MYTNTNFYSKKWAENFRDPAGKADRILISITTTAIPESISWNCKPARLHPDTWKAVLRLEFDDRDPNHMNPAERKHYLLFSEEQAISVLQFLKQHQHDTQNAIVHCEAGVSRSAAVSKFIAHIYGLDFPEKYDVYNRHVFSTLLKVHGESLHGYGLMKPEELPGTLTGETP